MEEKKEAHLAEDIIKGSSVAQALMAEEVSKLIEESRDMLIERVRVRLNAMVKENSDAKEL